MMANVKGQGDPIGLVEARGETYADYVTAAVSTPSNGLVETEIDDVNGLEVWAKAASSVAIPNRLPTWAKGISCLPSG